MVDTPGSDDLPMLPPGSVEARPSIPALQAAHAEQQPPGDDSLPLADAPPPSLMNSSWSVIGKRLLDAGERGIGLGTRATTEGLAALPGMAADVATWPMRVGQRAIGIPTTAPSDLINRGIDATGLPKPETPSEQNVSTVVRGGAAAIPSLAMGGAPTVLNAARLLLQGGAGGLAGEKASQSYLVPDWLKPSVALLAGMAGGKAADVAANLGVKGFNAVAGNMDPIYQAFQRSGINTRLLGTVAGGEGGQSAEAALSRVPFASSVLRPVQQKTVDQFGNAVERTAGQLDPAGVGVTAQTTGEALQGSYRNWVDNIFNGPQGRQETAWAPLNQRMAGTSVDAAPFRTALEDAAAPPKLASMPATQQAWGSGQARNWLDALQADVGTGNLSWEQAQAIRTRIGDAMGTPGIADAVGMQQLRKMYAGLAQGMENSAVANGQGGLFNQANAVTTSGHAFIENVGSKIAKANNPLQETVAPEQATNNILNGGDTHMQAVRTELPDAADVLAAYKLRQAATAKPSVASAYDDTSTGTFQTNMNRMRQNTPGGYGALYNDPAVQRQLDDLSTVAGRLRATERHLNTSGTAEQLGWMEYLRGIGEAAAEGKVGKLVGAVTIPPMIGRGGGKLLTSPTATRFAAARGAPPPSVPPGIGGLLGSVPGIQ